MKIIIVGCGKVGYTLAQQLDEEGHDITVVDTNGDKIEQAISTLDVQGIEGNGTTFNVLSEAGIKLADLLIAVTARDEVNLLCCLMAKKTGNCNTIARVRNPEYMNEMNYLRDVLGLSMVINPELTCARGISNLVEVPSALDFTTFGKGRANLIKLSIPDDSLLHNMTVADFSKKVHSKTLICAIERDGEVVIPNGNSVLQNNDKIYVVLPPSELHSLLGKLGIKEKRIKNVMIIGGSRIAYYLAKRLGDAHIQVKIIERDFATCENISEMLPHTLIIHGDATDRQVLLEEGIEDVDAFISLTNMDEENLVLSMFASKVSDAKIITKVDKVAFSEVVGELPIGNIACPKNITAKSIIQYVRGLQNSIGSNIETLYRIIDDKAELIEFRVNQESKVTGVPLMKLNIKKNLLVCGIIRNGKIITPSGKDTIELGDAVLIVTTNRGMANINDILV
ncbi:MAG: Trk system potassium transporter TrkA [Lachnospiraceae bacterium]|nr:Trk system potassium transporter TrkA [Lachnospiraceae bacterium]